MVQLRYKNVFDVGGTWLYFLTDPNSQNGKDIDIVRKPLSFDLSIYIRERCRGCQDGVHTHCGHSNDGDWVN